MDESIGGERIIVKDERVGNVRIVGMISPRRVITKDDLSEVFGVDFDEWEMVSSKPNKWDGFLRGEDKQPVVVELYQIKATLVRKSIIPIEYTVQPVVINPHLNIAVNEYQQGTNGKTLVVPDAQIGFRRNVRTGALDEFHDRKALSVVLQVALHEQPNEIVIMGDWLDFSEFTDKFSKEPGFYFTTQPALEEAAWWLAQFRLACPSANIVMLEGNHDKRLGDYLVNHIVSASGLSQVAGGITAPPAMSVPYLLNLKAIGVEYIEGYPNCSTVIGNTEFHHGSLAKSQPMATASKVADYAQLDTGFAHIHRIEMACSTKADGSIVRAFCPGCVCRLDYVVPGQKRGQQWQQGIAMVEYSGGMNDIALYHIQDGRALVNGNIYQHIEILEQLRNDTGWDF